MLERNALQAHSASTGKRLESELRQRLQRFTNPQLQLLARGTSDERSAMAWLAVLERILIATVLTREVLLDKLSNLDTVLRRSEMAAFYEACGEARSQTKSEGTRQVCSQKGDACPEGETMSSVTGLDKRLP